MPTYVPDLLSISTARRSGTTVNQPNTAMISGRTPAINLLAIPTASGNNIVNSPNTAIRSIAVITVPAAEVSGGVGGG